MKLSGSDRRFLVEKAVNRDLNCSYYTVKEMESGRLLRTFIVRISQTQAARPDVKQQIARWCELFPEKLPGKGEAIPADLNYVEKR